MQLEIWENRQNNSDWLWSDALNNKIVQPGQKHLRPHGRQVIVQNMQGGRAALINIVVMILFYATDWCLFSFSSFSVHVASMQNAANRVQEIHVEY